MNIRKLCLPALAMAIFLSVFGQPKTQQSELEAKTDALISEAIQEGQIIGYSGFIYKDGKVILYKSWGSRDREAGEPIERNTTFRIVQAEEKFRGPRLI